MAHEEQKTRFVELRAQGRSYAAIAKELGVSKGTLTAWSSELEAEIGKRDLSKVNTDKLLERQLRYFGELKGEYVETGRRTETGPKLNSSDIAEQLQMVLVRYRAGEINESQAKLEQAVLQSMLKAIEQTELAAKLERLEAVVQTRR
jgi:transposase